MASSGGAAAAAPAAGAATPADAAWAHSLPQPEHGCLLLANPLMFGASQTYFHMSVILVWAHDSRGSAGLILNRLAGWWGAWACGLGLGRQLPPWMQRGARRRVLRAPACAPLPACRATSHLPTASLPLHTLPATRCSPLPPPRRPTEYLVSRFGAGAGFLTPEFDKAQLYLGGDVGPDTVHLLHGVPDLAASSEVFSGVWVRLHGAGCSAAAATWVTVLTVSSWRCAAAAASRRCRVLRPRALGGKPRQLADGRCRAVPRAPAAGRV